MGNYEDINGKKVYLKSLSSYSQISNIFMKINGIWVAQNDISSVFMDNDIYIMQ